MNDSNTPVVADETEPEPTPENTAGTAAARPAASTALPLWIALLALGIGIGLVATAYFTWHQVQQLTTEQAGIEMGVSDRIQPLRSSLDGVNQSLRDERTETDNRIAAVDARVARLNQDQQSVGHRLNALAALMGRSERGWTLAEVEYLLRIANQRLQLQGDTHTARQALKAADERLRDLADPHYLSVREQIALDIDAVKAVPPVDVDGLAARLGSALATLDELAVAGTRYQPQPAAAETETVEAEQPARNFDELVALVWGSLSELFRIREHDQPVGPMLAPEREYFLRENLRLQLAAARLALLRSDRAQYRAALTTAADWLDRYFDAEDAKVKQLHSELGTMAAVEISPAVPDVSASLRLLRQQMQLSEQQAVLPVVPEAPVDDSIDTAPAEGAANADETPS